MLMNYETKKELVLERQISRIVNDEVKDQEGKKNIYSKRNKKIMLDFYQQLKIIHPKKEGKLETQKYYVQHLRRLIMDLDKDLDKVSREDLRGYLANLNETYTPQTIKGKKVFLIKFFPYFYGQGKEETQADTLIKLRKDLLKDVNISNGQEELTEKVLLTPQEINKLIGVSNNFRDQAIVSLLYETGARKGELLRMRIKHIDLNKRRVIVPKGKTTSRILPIIDSTPYLIQWINTHPEKDNPEAPLWITQGSHLGRAFQSDGLKALITMLCKRANIKKNITPHTFRHSRATEFSKQKVNEAFLRKWFGWSVRSRTPSLYIHIFADDLSDMYAELKGIKEAKQQFEEDKRELSPKSCPQCNTTGIPSYLRNCINLDCNYSFETDINTLKKELDDMKRTQDLLSKVFNDPERLAKLEQALKLVGETK